MSLAQQIEAVYQRALVLRDRATDRPIEPDLIETSLNELYFVLEELHAADAELHQQNQALAASRFEVEAARQRYQTLFELAPDGYLVTDKQGKIHHANRAASQLFGISPESLIGKPLLVLIDPRDRPEFQQRLRYSPTAQPWEITLTTRQTEPITVAITTNYLQDSRSQATTILWSLRDISDRCRMEQALQIACNDLENQVTARTSELMQANAQLQQEIEERRQAESIIRDQANLIDVATDAIYVLDPQQCVTFWNRGAATLYGWTAAEAVGQTVSDLFGQPAALATAQADAEPGDWQGEADHQTKDGRQVTVLSRQTWVDHDDDLVPFTLVVETDITEKKQLESEFLQAQRLESLGILARSIAHDLNNILSPLHLIPQVLLKRFPDTDISTQTSLEMIQRAAHRGADLAQQILAFAGQTQGKVALVDINSLLQEIQQFVQHTFPESIEIEVTISEDPKPVIADSTLLYQILLNLCVNARDAMSQAGTLTLSADNITLDETSQHLHTSAQPGNYVVITVADTGTGIAPEVIEHIFKPFFTTKLASQSSGLGLSTVIKIVRDCGGFVTVLSDQGKGCQFKVYLPIAQVPTPLSPAD